ncbi:hypothetical protein NLJ89_g3799 [Agrocybe chaxingu]|uniref:DUF6533 domain-containing protein n=1 Tax=Agrocybe chaxingu TaxID=84603 RepID=A0A9W8MX27_9AGAR|nr:hypothetical protein NLJ89_g3799 [Agrocybe chaxingu]
MSLIPDNDASAFHNLLTGFQRSEDAGYMNAAALAILLYDICTTIVDEVEFIWSERWTITKVLYLIARYYPSIFIAVTLRGQHSACPFTSPAFIVAQF